MASLLPAQTLPQCTHPTARLSLADHTTNLQMYNDRALDRRDNDNRNDLARMGDWPPLGDDRERSARPSPAGYGAHQPGALA